MLEGHVAILYVKKLCACIKANIDCCISLFSPMHHPVFKFLRNTMSKFYDRLQKVLNAAARVTCLLHKFDYITPVLRELHWLPVKLREEFKILKRRTVWRHNINLIYLL